MKAGIRLSARVVIAVAAWVMAGVAVAAEFDRFGGWTGRWLESAEQILSNA